MDKRQFADEVIERVRSLSVTSVLSSRIEIFNRYGYSKGLCPFHNDGKLGSFVASDKKNIWKCFACSAGGDTVKFVALYEGINYLESAFKLAVEYGVISSSEYHEYFERKRYTKDFVTKLERKYTEIDKKRLENDIADNDILDKVFRTFIGESTLSVEHKNHLMNERHLDEEDIKEGLYFTFPTRKKINAINSKLRTLFDDEELEVLERVPGFFKKRADNTWTFTYHKGIGIGIKNALGQVVGIQIRHDKKDEDRSRYVWFSSSFASFDEKYEFGTSSGSPIDVVYPKKITNRNVVITEGRFKAEQIAKKVGSIAISVQGVGSWRGIVSELKAIPTAPKLKELMGDKSFEINAVLSAFDADMNYKVQVFEQAKKMTTALEKVDDGFYPVYYLNWDENLGKGMDDVLIDCDMSVIKKYDKSKWDIHYDKMIRKLLEVEKTAVLESIRIKMPKTTEKDYDKMVQDYKEDKNWTILKYIPVDLVQSYFHDFFDSFEPIPKGQCSLKHWEKLEKMKKKQETIGA